MKPTLFFAGLALSLAAVSPAQAQQGAVKGWRFCTLLLQNGTIGDTGLAYISGDAFTALTSAHQNAGRKTLFCGSYGDTKSRADYMYNDAVTHIQKKGLYAGVIPVNTPGTAKPAGKPGSSPAITIDGPSQSDKEHAAKTKARAEKAVADEKKAQAAQAKRDADAKVKDDKLKADAAAAKAKAKAERDAKIAECASRGISAEKCPAQASRQ